MVVSVEGDGSNTGSYGDRQAAPLTLYQFAVNGNSGGSDKETISANNSN